MSEFRPFEDPIELEKIRQKRSELINQLENFDIPSDEKQFILRRIGIITQKLEEAARYGKEVK